MRVAQALGHPVLRQGPLHLSRATALVAGVALPLVLNRIIGTGRVLVVEVLAVVAVGAVVLARLQGRIEGWRIALGVLVVYLIYSVALHG
jgi:hypothetical protein